MKALLTKEREDTSKIVAIGNEVFVIDNVVFIVDFDDTIFERTEQFEEFPILIKNRGNKGNEVIRDIIGIENLIEKCFKGKKFPQGIPSLLRENHDLILTAGFDEIQKAKLKATGLDKFNYIIVPSAENKPRALIEYYQKTFRDQIHKGLRPEIVVFEDRPKVFVEHADAIKTFLQTKLYVMQVTMTSNNEEPSIKRVA